MNRISFAFVSALVAACSAEGTSAPSRTSVAFTDVAPGVLSPHAQPDVIDPGCEQPSPAVRQYGTTGEDAFRDVAFDANGDVLVAGSEGSRGIVLAYDTAFAPRAVIDTFGTDSVESLAIEPDTERVWLAVRSNGAMEGLPSYGGFDVTLAELRAEGARPLYRGFASTAEYPRQIAAGAGVVAIAGHQERLPLDDTTWVDPFIAMFDTSVPELPQWLLTRRVNRFEAYTAVDATADAVAFASAVLAGDEQGAYVVMRSRDADLVWQQRISITGGDSIAAVHIVPGGDVVWAGTAGGDIVIGRLDGQTGTPRWTARHGDDHDERVADLAVDDAGRLYVAGDVAATDVDQRDAFLLVLDRDGRPLAQEVWSSDGDDLAAAVAVDACGTAVLVGETTGDLGGPSHGGTDAFLIVTRAVGAAE